MTGGHRDAGSVTPWLLGLVVLLLFLGGLVIDLWRLLDARRNLAAAVDAAAVEAVGAVDVDLLRAAGAGSDDVRVRADVVSGAIAARLADAGYTDVSIGLAADGRSVEISAATEVPWTVTRVLLPTQPAATITVTAIAQPFQQPVEPDPGPAGVTG